MNIHMLHSIVHAISISFCIYIILYLYLYVYIYPYLLFHLPDLYPILEMGNYESNKLSPTFSLNNPCLIARLAGHEHFIILNTCKGKIQVSKYLFLEPGVEIITWYIAQINAGSPSIEHRWTTNSLSVLSQHKVSSSSSSPGNLRWKMHWDVPCRKLRINNQGNFRYPPPKLPPSVIRG